MNFLAHYVTARRAGGPQANNPSYIAGNALPDLLPLAAPRLRLRSAMLAGQDFDTSTDLAIAHGVQMHLATDTAFHGTRAFAQAQAHVRTLIAQAGFEAMRVRAFFLAHVTTELALDACLARQNTHLLEDFYAGFTDTNSLSITQWAETVTGHALPELPDVLARFGQSQYLRYYLTDAGVAEGLSRLCRRARQDTFDGPNVARLVKFVAQAVSLVGDYAPALLSETQESLP